ncbi:MAG: homoserine O-succinyltransferase [Oscillospiraceae bacterium]|nr:homoserine O-succinyltransferase [Oscillospiraceae bacterium]
MPIKIPDSLPATSILEGENIFVMTEVRALHQRIRPLKVLILNLMPTKIVTETQFLRKLSNTPLQIQVEFLQTATYKSSHVDPSHLDSFYTTFDQIKDRYYDGMIITGAPLEHVPCESAAYWPELCEIMEWSTTHVHSTMHVCWGAFAGLYYHYGVPKYDRDTKLFGVFPHTPMPEKRHSPLFRGLDDVFYSPHSRATELHAEDIYQVPELEMMSMSPQAGVFVVKSKDNKRFFILGHPEYDIDTLANEYWRDKNKGLPIQIPENYFPDDDPTKTPIVTWRTTGQLLYTNWLNYYVYQTTPYNLEDLKTGKVNFD